MSAEVLQAADDDGHRRDWQAYEAQMVARHGELSDAGWLYLMQDVGRQRLAVLRDVGRFGIQRSIDPGAHTDRAVSPGADSDEMARWVQPRPLN